MNERTINLSDFFAEIIYRWKMLVLFAVLGALVLGGFGYYITSRKESETVRGYEKQVEKTSEEQKSNQPINEAGSALSETQKCSVRNVIEKEKLYELTKQYNENSFLMKVDPFYAPRYKAILSIKGVDETDVMALGDAMLLQITDSTLYVDLETEFSINGEMDRIIKASLGCDGENTAILGITVYYLEKVNAERVIDLFLQQVNTMKEKYNNEFGDFAIEKIASSFGYYCDSELLSFQRTNITALTNYSSVIKEKAALANEELAYYDSLKDGDSNENNDSINNNDSAYIATTNPKVSALYILLGAVGFPIAYICVMFLLYIVSDNIRVCDNISEMYGVVCLGCMLKERKPAKGLRQLGDWIKYHSIVKNDSPDLLAKKISLLCENDSKIALCANAEYLDMCKEISTELKKATINSIYVGDLANSSEELTNMSGTQYTLLLVTTKDRHKSLKRKLEFICAIKQKNVFLVVCE